MPVDKVIIGILIMSAITFFTRAVPFLLFSSKDKAPPDLISYLGNYLPPAIICIILVYCFKDISINVFPYGTREIISVFIVIILHKWKRNTMISIFGGTLCYMLLVRFI